MVINNNFKTGLILFFIGMLGVASLVPLIPQLLASKADSLPFSMEVMILIGVAQSSVMLILMIWLGMVFSKKVGLTVPVISALVHSENALEWLKPQIKPAVIGGVLAGVIILVFSSSLIGYLPEEFIKAGENFVIPWYARIFYGGITEELLIRWGLMSFFVWGLYRLTQKKDSEIRDYNYIVAIILAALAFGILHLPVAYALTSNVTPLLIAYIVIGNSAFGFIGGYLFWKYGLECAIGAHMMTHVTMMVGLSFVG
ncbi:MAG: CPBP family glutamic-type intramembrane protease [Gammaproteobacteria bacterium]|nr:CPBP family glutamic-type intramembrane protease [Gammaproteobacteria bacterium]MDH5630942.1 CPBP family glutamic-type intramembrane protease [Gammaproteobacteria bacterium]